MWLPSPTGVYDARSAWEAVRTKFPVQPWAKVVWFKKNAPRWAFILWLAAQGKLNTKDRLHKWGMTADEICPLRSREQETHKHLFFGCSFSKDVWSAIWSKSSSVCGPNSLDELLDWFAQTVKGDSIRCRIMGCSLAAAVHFHLEGEKLKIVSTENDG